MRVDAPSRWNACWSRPARAPAPVASRPAPRARPGAPVRRTRGERRRSRAAGRRALRDAREPLSTSSGRPAPITRPSSRTPTRAAPPRRSRGGEGRATRSGAGSISFHSHSGPSRSNGGGGFGRHLHAHDGTAAPGLEGVRSRSVPARHRPARAPGVESPVKRRSRAREPTSASIRPRRGLCCRGMPGDDRPEPTPRPGDSDDLRRPRQSDSRPESLVARDRHDARARRARPVHRSRSGHRAGDLSDPRLRLVVTAPGQRGRAVRLHGQRAPESAGGGRAPRLRRRPAPGLPFTAAQPHAPRRAALSALRPPALRGGPLHRSRPAALRGGETSWENCVLACVQCNREGLQARGGLRYAAPARARAPQSPIFEVATTHQREAWRRFVSDRHWKRSG